MRFCQTSRIRHIRQNKTSILLLLSCIGASFVAIYIILDSQIFASRELEKSNIRNDFVLSGPTPQLTADDIYDDRLEALNTSDPQGTWHIDLEDLTYAVFLPTFTEHFEKAAEFIQSITCLCMDHSQVNFYVIASDSIEVAAFRDLLDNLSPCGLTFSRWKVPHKNRDGRAVNVEIINFFDILPDLFHGVGVSTNSTAAILNDRGKYIYQSLKKLASAAHFKYDYGLWLDSEAIAIRPFSFRNTFETYIKAPTILRSRMSNTDSMRTIMSNSAKVLGRSIDSFGSSMWTLESVEWIIEKEILSDMMRYVEAAHGRDFWSVWSENGGPFEVNLYNMHILARKSETASSIFSKYMILETEREMIRYGIAPAFPEMEFKTGTGFLERGYHLLRVPEIQPNLSAFLRRYGQRLFRLDDLGVTSPDTITKFLLDTPLDLLVCGAPPLHSWWKEVDSQNSLS